MTKSSSKQHSVLLRVLLLVLLLSGIAMAVIWRDQIDLNGIRIFLQDLGWVAGVAFMGIYAAGTVFFLPGAALTLIGGALFGPLWGTVFNLTGATIGAALAFLLSRYLGADWVRQKSGPRLSGLIKGVDEEGWRFVAFTRLVPLFPFNLLNYAFGLTRISLRTFVVTSYLAMMPGALAYTWLGHAGGQALAGEKDVIVQAIWALALITVVSFVPGWLKRRRLRAQSELEQSNG